MSFFRRFLSETFRWLIADIRFIRLPLPNLWATLAIYYSNIPWAELRIGLAAAFAVFSIWAIWMSDKRHMSTVAALLFLGVVAWWIAIPPRTIVTGVRKWR